MLGVAYVYDVGFQQNSQRLTRLMVREQKIKAETRSSWIMW